MGTKCVIISSTYIPLAAYPPTWKYNILVVAGCTANFATAFVCLGLLRRARPLPQAVLTDRSARPLPQAVLTDRSARPLPQAVLTERRVGITRPPLRYFLWLLMSVNLFLPTTYIAVATIIKFGDSYILIQNLPRQIVWRIVVSFTGATALGVSFRLCRNELARLIGAEGRAAQAIAWELVVPAYLTGGILTVTSALFSQLAAKWAQLEAAGGTFGLTIWLLFLPLIIPRAATPEREPFRISRSIGWILAGALTAVIFIGVLGRGIAL